VPSAQLHINRAEDRECTRSGTPLEHITELGGNKSLPQGFECHVP